jgi:hypothetical protein
MNQNTQAFEILLHNNNRAILISEKEKKNKFESLGKY